MKIGFDPKSARVMKGEERLKAANYLREVDHPPVIDLWQGKRVVGKDLFDMKKSLLQQLRQIEHILQYENDYTPCLNTVYGIVVHAEAFGCEVVWPEDQAPWVKPIINRPTDVYSLKKPNSSNCTLARRVLDTISYYQKEVGAGIPIAHTDTLSPFNVAYLMWKHSEFFIACQTNPKAVHHLLKMITEFIIEFTRMQFDLMKNPARQIWPYRGETHEPLLTEDMAALVSPEFLQEFSLPYLTEISNAFGGLYIHSCGHNVHNLDTFLLIPKFRGIHIVCSPTNADPKAAMEKLYGHCAVFPTLAALQIGWRDNPPHDGKEAYRDYYLPGILAYGGKGIILRALNNRYLSGVSERPGSEESIEVKNELYNWVVSESMRILKM